MKQIDFHFHVANRSLYACKLVKKVSAMGLTVGLWSRDEAFLEKLYDDLWRFEDLSFISHAWVGTDYERETSVLFSTDITRLGKKDVLIALDEEVPQNWQDVFTHFDRIVDIVPTAAEALTRARTRYRIYKASGVPLNAYDRSGK